MWASSMNKFDRAAAGDYIFDNGGAVVSVRDLTIEDLVAIE